MKHPQRLLLALALVAATSLEACRGWVRPECNSPGAHSCVNNQPHYCSEASHELTPIGDEPCDAQGRVCAINEHRRASCVRRPEADAGISTGTDASL